MIYIRNGVSFFYDNGQVKEGRESLAIQAAEMKQAIIIEQPQQEKNYNGIIDIDTNLPMICYPIWNIND